MPDWTEQNRTHAALLICRVRSLLLEFRRHTPSRRKHRDRPWRGSARSSPRISRAQLSTRRPSPVLFRPMRTIEPSASWGRPPSPHTPASSGRPPPRSLRTTEILHDKYRFTAKSSDHYFRECGEGQTDTQNTQTAVTNIHLASVTAQHKNKIL